MHQRLKDALITSARSGVRWSGSLRNEAMYCAFLLEAGELCLLQQILHRIPGIEDGDKAPSDIM